MAQHIPWQLLSDDAKEQVLTESVSRDGTDYGLLEASIVVKKEQLRANLENKKAFLFYDEDSDTINVIPESELDKLPLEIEQGL
ncbi:MAG: YheU family protein [Bdellovibrionales bacterium]